MTYRFNIGDEVVVSLELVPESSNHLPVLNEPKYKKNDRVGCGGVIMTVFSVDVEYKTGAWFYTLIYNGCLYYKYEKELSPIHETYDKTEGVLKYNPLIRHDQITDRGKQWIYHPGYPPTLDEIAIDEYKKTYNQKQKKGIKQVMSRLFEMCEGWLDPDKKEIVKAFMDTTYGTINFEHPKLQQYLIEQWAADKKMVALAKQVNEEKETK